MNRRRRVLGPVLAVMALGLLTAMVLSGRLMENRQLVRFEAAGVMPETPDQIDRVEVAAGSRRWRFVRGRDGWRTEAGPAVAAALATSLADAIKFMHVSAPVRVMEREEWTPIGLREFGLDPPAYTAILYRRDAPVLTAAFGGPNPQQVLQYMTLPPGDRVYLMSRFIGEEWEKVMRDAPPG